MYSKKHPSFLFSRYQLASYQLAHSFNAKSTLYLYFSILFFWWGSTLCVQSAFTCLIPSLVHLGTSSTLIWICGSRSHADISRLKIKQKRKKEQQKPVAVLSTCLTQTRDINELWWCPSVCMWNSISHSPSKITNYTFPASKFHKIQGMLGHSKRVRERK